MTRRQARGLINEENRMLVLSRKRGERIVIGDNIKLTVIAVHGQRVQLVVNAPRNVVVRRDELLERSGPEGIGSKATEAARSRANDLGRRAFLFERSVTGESTEELPEEI